MLDVAIDRSRDKGRFSPDCYTDGIERVVDNPHRCTLGHLSFDARRRKLSLGQSIDSVIEQNDVQIDIAAKQVNEVVSTDT